MVIVEFKAAVTEACLAQGKHADFVHYAHALLDLFVSYGTKDAARLLRMLNELSDAYEAKGMARVPALTQAALEMRSNYATVA